MHMRKKKNTTDVFVQWFAIAHPKPVILPNDFWLFAQRSFDGLVPKKSLQQRFHDHVSPKNLVGRIGHDY